MLEVKRVSKRYDGGRGVREIDFSMRRGEIVGFLGPNGAGKTTTMRMITGYLYPTEGTITVDGLSVHEQARKARSKIGYLPETPPLYPDLTVEAYLKFVAKLRGVPAREQKLRTAEMVARLGLGGRERQSIRHLSKGYKQRLGLAQAIIHKPDLLVLDEPTSGLDPSQIIEIRSLIRELGENHTVLLSTHILQEVGALCDRVLIINRGELVMDGAPDEIGARMENRFAVTLEVYGQRERIESVLSGWAGSRGITAEIRSVPEPKGQTSETESLESKQSTHQQLAVERTSVENGTDPAAPSHELLAETETAAEIEPVAALPQSVDLFASSSEVVRALLTADGQEDFRLDLFRLLAEADLPILELHKENLTLEDVFLKLTTEDQADGLVGKDGLGTDGSVRVETDTQSGEERA
ncbi:ATP-binding cassette domain-containing protein [Saccharibacillus qingshengii]|uniref:ATP-binding cassette domain-containing protein n=1 Tax=Saccharibacillus qingshengii TaxID=1763540 RepID=UPI001555E89E